MNTQEFVECIKRKEVPTESPDCTSLLGHYSFSGSFKDRAADYSAREEISATYGMWAIITKSFAKTLAEFIGDKRCLEIMSGAGWLAKALSEQGIKIIATDNNSWKHSQHSVFEVLNYEASEAVETYKDSYDILICSWPPYSESRFTDACKKWGKDKLIIYIGESHEGCNANEEFFNSFHQVKTGIGIMSWPGLHDDVMIGYWREEK